MNTSGELFNLISEIIRFAMLHNSVLGPTHCGTTIEPKLGFQILFVHQIYIERVLLAFYYPDMEVIVIRSMIRMRRHAIKRDHEA